MKNVKAGARHSASDMQSLAAIKGHAQQIMEHCAALGAAEDMPAKAVQIAPDAHPGAMVALMLSPDQQAQLRRDAGMPDAEADHITLAYLGPDASAMLGGKIGILQALAGVAAETQPIEGVIGGAARFNASESSDGQDVIVALYDAPELPDLYDDVCECLCECGVTVADDHGFIPHVTLTYIPTTSDAPLLSLPRTPLTFTALSLIWAGERIDLPLMGMPEDMGGEMEQPNAPSGATGMEPSVDPQPVLDAGLSLKTAPMGAIKAIGDYTLKIRGIERGGKDLIGDTFTPNTDLGFERSPIGMPVFYDHAQRGIKSQVGKVVAWEDTGDAIDFTVELDRAKRYAQQIMQLAAQKVLGGSTGAVGHLVVSEGGALKRWIVGELSLTVTPCEPRTRPDLRDTKSADAPELGTEAGHDQPAVVKSVLPALVMAYTTLSEHDIKTRLGAVHHGG